MRPGVCPDYNSKRLTHPIVLLLPCRLCCAPLTAPSPLSAQGGVAGGSILRGVLKEGDEIEIRPGMISKSGGCVPIHSRVMSLFAEKNTLKYAVPGGLIGVGTKIDPAYARSDRLVGQVRVVAGEVPVPSMILYNYPCPRRPKKGGMQRNLYENSCLSALCSPAADTPSRCLSASFTGSWLAWAPSPRFQGA